MIEFKRVWYRDPNCARLKQKPTIEDLVGIFQLFHCVLVDINLILPSDKIVKDERKDFWGNGH